MQDYQSRLKFGCVLIPAVAFGKIRTLLSLGFLIFKIELLIPTSKGYFEN